MVTNRLLEAVSGALFSNGDTPPSPQSLAKLTVNFQSSLSVSGEAGEAANSTGNAGDSCNLQQYCDTGCQTDIMGEVGGGRHPWLRPLAAPSRRRMSGEF